MMNEWCKFKSGKFFNSKILSVKWLDEWQILTCGADGKILILRISDKGGNIISFTKYSQAISKFVKIF